MREMKDSGVEWIGEIPEDWNVGKTLYALSMPITDGPHETPELFDEGIPFISAEAVSCGNGQARISGQAGSSIVFPALRLSSIKYCGLQTPAAHGAGA